MFLKRISLICEGALTDVMKSCSPGAKSIIAPDWHFCFCYSFLLFDWLGLIPLFSATAPHTVQEVLCLCKVTFLASPPSVCASLNTSPTPHLTHSPASCVETGTVTCARLVSFPRARTHTHKHTRQLWINLHLKSFISERSKKFIFSWVIECVQRYTV